MPELVADVRDRRTFLQQQRRERVPHLMRATTMHARAIEDAVERLPHVRFVECRSGDENTQSGNGRPTASQAARCWRRHSRSAAVS
jgi:hypothetical protein